MSRIKDRYDKFSDGSKPRKQKEGYENEQIERILSSHISLSRMLGFLGILLPFSLLIGTYAFGEDILPSISDYFHSSLNCIFIGIICTIAAFLFTHNGSDYAEKIIYSFASLFALFVVVFPTPNKNILEEGVSYTISDLNVFQTYSNLKPAFVGYIHFICAALFFILLIIIVLWKFVEREKKSPHPSKKRICLYRICGYGMLFSIVGIMVFKIFFSNLGDLIFPITFTGEMIALIFFGIAWLVKGEIEELDISYKKNE